MKRFSIVLVALLTLFNAQVSSKIIRIVSASSMKDVRTPMVSARRQYYYYKDSVFVRAMGLRLRDLRGLAQDAGTNDSQFNKSFYSNDESAILSGIEYMYSFGDAPLANNGQIDFTYDANGILIGYESTQINAGDIIDICNETDLYPIGATVKTVVDDDPDNYRKEIYYIDPLSGERHDVSIKRYKYFNDEPELIIAKELDENGIMTEYAKVESQYDSQGRPTVTFIYTPHFTKQGERYLGIYRKYEYEYLSDGMISKTTCSWVGQDGDGHWEYMDRVISGYDSEGYYCYEKMDYDLTESTWSGNQKFRCLLSDDETQYTQINWTWDSDVKKWTLFDNSFCRYNPKGLVTYQENYLYDTILCAFYMSSTGGFDYQGDTLRISDWLIAFDAPESLEPLSQQAHINYSSKNEYFYNKDNRMTSSAHYELNEKGQWVLVSKDATLYYASGQIWTYYRFCLDIQGADSVWVIDELKNVEIDNAGNIILDESYSTWDNNIDTWQTGSIYEWEYSPSGKLLSEILSSIDMGDTTRYKTLYSYDDAGRTELISKYLQNPNETDLILYGKEEYTFDTSTRTLTSQTSDLDQENQWQIMGKTLRQLDSNDRTLLFESYTWDSEASSWIGVNKEENLYNEQGDTVMSASYEWDDMLNDWIGLEKNCINSKNDTISAELYFWDYDRNDWFGGRKLEYYSDEDKLIEAQYSWNYTTWCWEGADKSEIIFGSDDYNFTDIEYEWDADKMDWVAGMKYVFENEETDSYSYERTTSYGWNNLTSQWDCGFRDTEQNFRNNAGNLDYILTTREKPDDNTNDWKTVYTLKDVYVYTGKTEVEKKGIINADIIISDGTITVSTADDSLISITSASGTPIANGHSALSVPVSPGIYMITVGSRTTKVIVH